MKSSPELSARHQLLELQKATFARLQEDLRAHRQRGSVELKTYQRRYDREVRKFRRLSSKTELTEQVNASSLVYCGDFHTLRQAQRTPIKILRSITGKRKEITLGLELLPAEMQPVSDAFLKGSVDEETFLRRIGYQDRWGFPWNHYRQLYDFARDAGIRIIGLNSEFGDRIPLEARDDLAADIIVRETIRSPEALIFVLYGDLHIAESNIPRRVSLRLERQNVFRKYLILFQNSESIYWELAEKGLADEIDVVHISRNKFCILSAAPWVKWQSYQSWLEDQSELLDIEGGDTKAVDDYYHQVLALGQQIAGFLKVDPPHLDQFSILTAADVKIIKEIRDYCRASHQRDVPIEEIIRSEIIYNRAAYFPEPSILYLSDLSENRAAEKAAQLLAAKLSPGEWLYRPKDDRREVFYRLVLWEAIGFMGSKIVNPKRKCDQYKDFEHFLIYSERKKLSARLSDRRAVSAAILAHYLYEGQRMKREEKAKVPRRVYSLPPRRFFAVASSIGQILAHRLYSEMVADRVSLKEIRALFLSPGSDKDGARKRYFDFVTPLRSPRVAHESKEDRF